ncbi:MAG: bifunctional DNA-formamidopyrimidine glycosylase/DNA-(apurinic or apyrimidinic site) lyase [Planctomycetota bacterium]
MPDPVPELPEVETVRRGLAGHLPGLSLDEVELRRPDLRFPIPVKAVEGLEGLTCREVARRSKYLLLHFEGQTDRDAHTAISHLGMSGRIFLEDTSKGRPDWELHEHWRMHFGRWTARYVDPRRFGMLDVAATQHLERHRLLRSLGPEPLEDDFHGGYLFDITRSRRQGIKVTLMDAKIVVGVGNIYASESCFRAGVRPRRAAGRVTRNECHTLAESIRDVLREAIAAGGTTLRDYTGIDRDAGYFAQKLFVYGREGEPCRHCGSEITKVVTTGRATFYCPTCQR